MNKQTTKKKGGVSGVINIFEYLRRGMLNVNYGLDFNPLWIQDGEDLSGFNVGPVDQMYFMTCKKKIYDTEIKYSESQR